MFYLVRLDRDGDGNLVETPLPDYGTFDKGADAAKASKAAAAATGAKVQCRRMAQAGDWRGAMLKRFESGELIGLPPAWDLDPVKDHFAHLAKIDTSNIGYIDTEEHGIIYKVTVLTPGRYISRFYPQVDDDKRRHLIAAIDPSGEIYFATTPEEIEDVYRNGPSSCMDGTKDFDDLPVWPTAPYGAGDLAVAYQRNKDGNIQSRCVCWPEKMLFGRIYGDYQRLKSALEAEGYTWMRERNDVHGNKKLTVFIGAKLLKIPTGNKDHEYVMPYFDDIKVAIDKGDHFVTADQGEPGQTWINSGSSDDGTAILHRMCPRHKVAVPINDMRYVHGADEEWCMAAIRSDAFVCNATGHHYPHEMKVVLGDARLWSKAHFEQHGEYCYFSRKNWPRAEMVERGDKRMHRTVADRYDDNGNELAIIPRKRTAWEDASVRNLQDRVGAMSPDAFADMMVARPRDSATATELVLNRNRRVA